MNGPCQEMRGPERQILEERKQRIIVLLARMVHQRLIASRPDSREGEARKAYEFQGPLRDPLRR